MSWVGVGVGVVGAGSNIWSAFEGQKQEEEKIEELRNYEISSARLQVSAVRDSTLIMQSLDTASATNAAIEAMRVGAANNEELKQNINKTASTLAAQSEGLTSGNSQGRQMVSLYIQGNKVLQQSRDKTTSVINQITSKLDERTNDLNNKVLTAEQQMLAILAAPTAKFEQNTGQIISGGISGFSSGFNLGSQIKSTF